MASRSMKRTRMSMTSGARKVLSQNLAAIPRKRMAFSSSKSRSRGKISSEIFRKCTASSSSKSRSRKVEEGEGKISSDIFRKCTASKSRKEEGLEGLHLIVTEWHKQRYRFSTFSCYDQIWSRKRNYPRSPFPKAQPKFRGRCNGLLCLEFSTTSSFSNSIGNKFVVFEPSTNKLQVIPRPSSMNRPCYCSSKYCCLDVLTTCCGLHFDSHSGDYKIFSFIRNYYYYPDDEGNNMDGFHDITYHAQVYSVKNNVWKELTYPLSIENDNEEIIPGGSGICVNGVVYWRARCSGDYSFILSYNLVTEEFSSFHGPKLTDTYELVELDGSLGLLIYPNVPRSADWKGIISLMVYSSSSSSWSRADSGFEKVPVVGFHHPLWFGKRNNTYSLLLKGPQSDLVEYDYTRKVFNKIHKVKHIPGYINAFAYETKMTENNANIWHSSSFHDVEVQDRFAVYAAPHQSGDNY